jgi:hypothetical protein
MPDYSTRPLDVATWPDFARLVEATGAGFVLSFVLPEL